MFKGIEEISKVAVFGSAFNPPTRGHQDVLEQIAPDFDEIWLVPNYQHAWGKKMAPYEQRCAMVNAFISDNPTLPLRMMAVEQKLASKLASEPGTDKAAVYTIDLMRYLTVQHAHCQFSFVIGPDNAAQLEKFKGAAELKRRWPIISTVERQPIRSTLVRERVLRGEPIDALVTPGVNRLLRTLAYYRPESAE